MNKEMYVPSIEHAAALVGGSEALANRLGVTPEELLGWVRGTQVPSIVSLLRVLDVVIIETRDLSRAAMAQGVAEMALAKAAAQARASHPESER